MDRVIAKRTVTRDIGNHERVIATIQLHQLSENQRPYFSATGELVDLTKRGDNAIISCGSIHAEILEHMPELAPVVRVHLSDDRGQPMHAVENALYWLGRTKWQTYDRATLCGHLRVTEEEADRIHAYVTGDETEHDCESLGYMLKTLHMDERWRAEAAAALAVIEGGD